MRTASVGLPRAFFQPILTSFLSEFSVPEDFRPHILLARDESDRGNGTWVKLKNSWEQKTWQVWLDTDCNWCLKDGWEEFALHHHIRVGHLVVFNLVSTSTFQVSVFDAMTSCQIYYPEESSVKDPNQKVKVKVEYMEEGEESRPDAGLTLKYKVPEYTQQQEDESRQDDELKRSNACLTMKHKVSEYTRQREDESRQDKEMKGPNAGLTEKHKVPEYTQQREDESRQDDELKRSNACLIMKHKVPEYTQQREDESRQDKEMKGPNAGLTEKHKVPEYTQQREDKSRQDNELKRSNACLTMKHNVPEYTQRREDKYKKDNELKRSNACLTMKHKVPEYTQQREEKSRQDFELKRSNACLTMKHKVPEYTQHREDKSRQGNELKRSNACLTMKHKVPEYTQQRGGNKLKLSKAKLMIIERIKQGEFGQDKIIERAKKRKVLECSKQGEEESMQNKETKVPEYTQHREGNKLKLSKTKLMIIERIKQGEFGQDKIIERAKKRKVLECSKQREEESMQNKETKQPESCLLVERKVPESTTQGEEESRQDKEMNQPNTCLTMKLKAPEYKQSEEESRQNKEMKPPNACFQVKSKVSKPEFRFSGNPYFCATVKKYCFRWPGMLIPIEFAKTHGLYRQWCDVILIDEIQRKWMIHLRYRKRGKDQTYLSAGWDEFQAANGLEYGDEIALELISAGERPEMRFHKLSDAKQKCPTGWSLVN